jgi:hypothetical protein
VFLAGSLLLKRSIRAMSVRPISASLSSRDGELILVRHTITSHLLERLLEVLAELPYPINPQLYHGCPTILTTTVEFPAYESWTPAIRAALQQRALPTNFTTRPMVEELRLAG